MNEKKLGKGLSALIPKRATTPESGERIVDVPVPAVRGNPYQPRERIEHGSLEELVDSIRVHGILEPLIVTPTASGYELIVGHRRLAAATLAGLATVPAIVRSATAQQKLEIALVENLQRHALNPLEEARAFQRLATEFDLTHAAIARQVGRSRAAVTNTVRLLQLPEEIQNAIADGRISAGHARAILALEDPRHQKALFRKVLGEGLSVRRAEGLTRRAHARGSDKTTSPGLERRAEELSRILGTRVTIESTGRGGRVILSFFEPEDLDALLERIRMLEP
jgi:ParB family chromosome partitioning protein